MVCDKIQLGPFLYIETYIDISDTYYVFCYFMQFMHSITDVFESFLLLHHRSDLESILQETDEEKHYQVTIK